MKKLIQDWIDINNKIQLESNPDISLQMIGEFRSLERYIQEKIDNENYTIGDILNILEDIEIDIELWSASTQSLITQSEISLNTPVKFMRLYFELAIFI